MVLSTIKSEWLFLIKNCIFELIVISPFKIINNFSMFVFTSSFTDTFEK